jgi:hypothetical protein
MLKNNIERTEIAAADYVHEQIEHGSRLDPMVKFIAPILNDHFSVLVFSSRSRTAGTTICYIYGTPENVEIASYVYAFLRRALADLWAEYKARTGAQAGKKGAFLAGVYHGLDDQLKRSKASFEAETGLVVAQDAELARYESRMRSRSSRVKGDAEAQAAGTEAGKNLRIRKGVSAGSSHSGRFLT